MNIYLVYRTDNVEYDEFDAFVVIAKSEDEAKSELLKNYGGKWANWTDKNKVKLIGTTDQYDKFTEILGSYNAG